MGQGGSEHFRSALVEHRLGMRPSREGVIASGKYEILRR
jgi:hypothetical protein